MSHLPLPSDDDESLDTIEVKHFSGSDRYAVLYLGERVKQVSYQDSRSQKDAEAIAKRIAEGVRNAAFLMISQ